MTEYQKIEYRINKDSKITEAIVDLLDLAVLKLLQQGKKRWEKWKAKNYYRSIMRATRT